MPVGGGAAFRGRGRVVATRALTYRAYPTVLQADALVRIHRACVGLQNALIDQARQARERVTLDHVHAYQQQRSACCGTRLRDGRCRCHGCGQPSCLSRDGHRCTGTDTAATERVVRAGLLLDQQVAASPLCGSCLRPCRSVALCATCAGRLRRSRPSCPTCGAATTRLAKEERAAETLPDRCPTHGPVVPVAECGPNAWVCATCGPRAKALPDSQSSDCHGAPLRSASRDLSELRQAQDEARGALNGLARPRGQRRHRATLGLHQVPVKMLHDVLDRVGRSLEMARKGKGGEPRFRSAPRVLPSIGWAVQDNPVAREPLALHHERSRIVLKVPTAQAAQSPQVGTIRLECHRYADELVAGAIVVKHIIVSRDAAGRWWATLQCDEVPVQPLPSSAAGREVGVDFGLQPIAVLSDGSQIPAPQHLDRALAQGKPEPGKPRKTSTLKRAQRAVSRKLEVQKERRQEAAAQGKPRPPESKRLARAKLRVAKQHARVAAARKDFAHKLSHALVYGGEVAGVRLDGAERIALEKISVAQMVERTHSDPEIRDPASLNRRDLDAGWAQIVTMTEAKAAAVGSIAVPVPAQRGQKDGGRVASAKRIEDAGRAVWSAPEGKKSAPRSKRGGRRQVMPSQVASPGSPRAGDGGGTQAGSPLRVEGIGSTIRRQPSASAPVEATTILSHTDLCEQRGGASSDPTDAAQDGAPRGGVLAAARPRSRKPRGSD